ncbi:hypothetical protein PENTCL1PPCAC_428, partial [Pristionchus entomophagus]
AVPLLVASRGRMTWSELQGSTRKWSSGVGNESINIIKSDILRKIRAECTWWASISSLLIQSTVMPHITPATLTN